MMIDEYHDLWNEVVERHADEGDGWEESLVTDWLAECAVRGQTERGAIVLANMFIDDVERMYMRAN